MTRVQYTKEFKLQALELAEQLGSLAAAAKQLGIPDSSIYNWKIKYKPNLNLSEHVKVVAPISAESEEIRRLRKENEWMRFVKIIFTNCFNKGTISILGDTSS